MVVMLLRFTLRVAVYEYGDVSPHDAALNIRYGRELGFTAKYCIHAVQEIVTVGMQFKEGGCKHVTCAAHSAVDIQCFHLLSSISVKMIYHAGEVARAKAIIYVDYRHTARTGVEHAEQSCNAAK